MQFLPLHFYQIIQFDDLTINPCKFEWKYKINMVHCSLIETASTNLMI